MEFVWQRSESIIAAGAEKVRRYQKDLKNGEKKKSDACCGCAPDGDEHSQAVLRNPLQRRAPATRGGRRLHNSRLPLNPPLALGVVFFSFIAFEVECVLTFCIVLCFGEGRL